MCRIPSTNVSIRITKKGRKDESDNWSIKKGKMTSSLPYTKKWSTLSCAVSFSSSPIKANSASIYNLGGVTEKHLHNIFNWFVKHQLQVKRKERKDKGESVFNSAKKHMHKFTLLNIYKKANLTAQRLSLLSWQEIFKARVQEAKRGGIVPVRNVGKLCPFLWSLHPRRFDLFGQKGECHDDIWSMHQSIEQYDWKKWCGNKWRAWRSILWERYGSYLLSTPWPSYVMLFELRAFGCSGSVWPYFNPRNSICRSVI